MSVNVTGNGNNVAGRDLNQHHHYHQTPDEHSPDFIRRELIAQYAALQSFNDSRTRHIRKSMFNAATAVLFVSGISFLLHMHFLLLPFLSEKSAWQSIESNPGLDSPTLIIGLTVILLTAMAWSYRTCNKLYYQHRRTAELYAVKRNQIALQVQELNSRLKSFSKV